MTEAFDPALDLDRCIGQRSATYRFALTNGVTGEVLGDIHPIRPASLSHDTARVVKRELGLALTASDTAAIDTLQDRVSVYMVIPDAGEYPLGRYMFADASRQLFTSGCLGEMVLVDEMFLVDQAITQGLNGAGELVINVIIAAIAGLPVTANIEPSTLVSAESWGVGAYRGSQVLESLAVSGDYFSPWFDNAGVLRFIRTFNPAMRVPDIDLDRWPRVYQESILETDDLLTAPNTFVVVSNAAEDPSVELVGLATVAPSAPNSVSNRGFAIAQVQNLQLSNQAQADAVAQGLAQRFTTFEQVILDTAPDPRHDSYNVIRWQDANWLELSWSLTLLEGQPMTHTLRKGYGGTA
jgi:hypothetical protein